MASWGAYRGFWADAMVYSQREGEGYVGGGHVVVDECVVSLLSQLMAELTRG